MTAAFVAAEKQQEDVVTTRVYDAAVIGEPLAIGTDRRRVWEKLMDARIVYLGEVEQVSIREDKALELEIVRSLSWIGLSPWRSKHFPAICKSNWTNSGMGGLFAHLLQWDC
ncbi:hypothetical protein MRB53_013962 [Persea americana]|uniref:Uncharacterized protein n=1 Tax=Persea americana TaxID=3435 RepID=A0ACC2K9L4_PERAE|nr:hypothetical protein MRB53_013962 [Persea americana]